MQTQKLWVWYLYHFIFSREDSSSCSIGSYRERRTSWPSHVKMGYTNGMPRRWWWTNDLVYSWFLRVARKSNHHDWGFSIHKHGFTGDPDMPLPAGIQWDNLGKKLHTFIIFESFVIFWHPKLIIWNFQADVAPVRLAGLQRYDKHGDNPAAPVVPK